MAKKPTFDELPVAVGKILDILTSKESGIEVSSQILQRLSLLKKKIDHIQKTLSPTRPDMDMQTVCRILKIRPKTAYSLASEGILPSHSAGRKTLFYEDDVVKYFMTQPTWISEVSKPVAAEPTPAGVSDDGGKGIEK